ncbi:MAG: PEP-CTERM sorting domain-containing protein, partial [Lacipirellulaceae bacterium]
YPPTSNPVEPDPQPKVDPEVVEPVGLSEDEIEFFRMIGIEITASGEVIPPQNPGPAEPVEIIDTEEELQDFFTSVGITIDENGSPVTSTPTELPPATPSDINELLSSLGIPYGSPAFAQAVAANSSLAVPEPSSLLLAGMLANFALLRRKRT